MPYMPLLLFQWQQNKSRLMVKAIEGEEMLAKLLPDHQCQNLGQVPCFLHAPIREDYINSKGYETWVVSYTMFWFLFVFSPLYSCSVWCYLYLDWNFSFYYFFPLFGYAFTAASAINFVLEQKKRKKGIVHGGDTWSIQRKVALTYRRLAISVFQNLFSEWSQCVDLCEWVRLSPFHLQIVLRGHLQHHFDPFLAQVCVSQAFVHHPMLSEEYYMYCNLLILFCF